MAARTASRPRALSTAARAAEVMARCDDLARYSEETGAITRPYGTESLRRARETFADWMREVGMEVQIDAIGALRGRYEGTNPSAPALLLGSHIDSVRDAGRYDGILGVLIGLAAAERLHGEGRRLPFPVEIVAFPDEEGLRFQTTYLGSSALAGNFDPAWLELRDGEGTTLRAAVAAMGGDPDAVAAAALRSGEAFAYVEVHIEQGPYLESVDTPVGVVSGISGQSRLLLAFTGEAGHAGTVAMRLRRDPMPAAAELILATEQIAKATPGLLATVAKVEARPGASNVIPGSVELSLDVRHPEDSVRLGAVKELETEANRAAARRSLQAEWRLMRDHRAVPCDSSLTEKLAAAVATAGIGVERLPSGAGHDAAVMSTVLPVAMLFVRCAGGISHRPDESVTVNDVTVAIDVMDRFIAALAAEARP